MVTSNPTPKFSVQDEIRIKISYLTEYKYLNQAKSDQKMKIILFPTVKNIFLHSSQEKKKFGLV